MAGLHDFLYPPITFGDFVALRAKAPKRICFGTTHRTALKRADKGAIGYLNVPFLESFSEAFPWPLFANTRGQHGGFYRAIKTRAEYDEISAWIGERANLVFIRSLFKIALAAGEHYNENARTEIGELEKAAKYDADLSARKRLLAILQQTFVSTLSRTGVDGLISVPSSNPAVLSLPNYLASKLSQALQIPDLTAAISWARPKGEIKTLSVEQKWHALEAAGLNVDRSVSEMNLLLIDDMYQSGATAHFVGSQLRAARVKNINLLCVSKGRRDTDNK